MFNVSNNCFTFSGVSFDLSFITSSISCLAFTKSILGTPSFPQTPFSIKTLLSSTENQALSNILAFSAISSSLYFQFTSGTQTLCASSIAFFCSSVNLLFKNASQASILSISFNLNISLSGSFTNFLKAIAKDLDIAVSATQFNAVSATTNQTFCAFSTAVVAVPIFQSLSATATQAFIAVNIAITFQAIFQICSACSSAGSCDILSISFHNASYTLPQISPTAHHHFSFTFFSI
ncbi:MAG: hypothetical protein LBC61_07140, partial [Candidatus Peribacteria bacterium]|nr:hypothetical protein [Candidatus Peribacteria bacterium]